MPGGPNGPTQKTSIAIVVTSNLCARVRFVSDKLRQLEHNGNQHRYAAHYSDLNADFPAAKDFGPDEGARRTRRREAGSQDCFAGKRCGDKRFYSGAETRSQR